MTEYLIVFKGDDHLPIHALSFEKAMDDLEECIGNGAEIHYALIVDFDELGRPEGFSYTETFEIALRWRAEDREAEARRENRAEDHAAFKRDLMKAEG